MIPRLVRFAGYADETPLVAAVGVTGKRLVFAQGAADDGTPFGPGSLVYAASLAKQLTGACAALLEREGLLDVEASVREWLPELPEWSEQVRVRHLLHHTSGLPNAWPRMEVAGETDWTSPGVLAALAATPRLDREPGSAYAYSNEGYVCLARVIERSSGSTLDALAQARIFEPLGMRDTLFWTGPSPAPPAAAVRPHPDEPAPLSVGDGGLWTSVRDLLRWNDAIFEDALGIAARTHTPGSLDDGTRLEYAWGVRTFSVSGEVVHSHGGSYGNAAAKLVRLPERRAGFAVLAADGSVERMVSLSDALQDYILRRSARPVS